MNIESLDLSKYDFVEIVYARTDVVMHAYSLRHNTPQEIKERLLKLESGLKIESTRELTYGDSTTLVVSIVI